MAVRLLADNNPSPTQSPYSVYPPYQGAAINQPFPDNYYGADHGGSSLSLGNPYASPFGATDHSRGVFTYRVAPFTPRGSEGVYGMDVWLEQQDSSGNWSVANANRGVPDQGHVYQAVNTPNPGPSPSYMFTWTYFGTPLPAHTSFRVFVYVYLYNQGGGSQGNFYVGSSTSAVSTGTANDAPRISWTAAFGALNPAQVNPGQTYTISADAQDDNGNLVAVSINKNGQPFAYAGGGNGYSGNSQNPTSDPAGTVTYTAWAGDSSGASSPAIAWTVLVGKANQAAVSSANATLPYYSQAFTPAYYGGSGSGSWQFAVAGYTNWTIAGDSNAGTELYPGNAWSPSWMPPAPGVYYFWVAKDGDGGYNPSAPAGLYALTVTPSPPAGYFDGVGPSALPQGQTLAGNGWAADPQMGAPVSSVQILIDNGANGSFAATLGGYRPDVQQANVAWGHWSPLDVTNSGWSFNFSTAGLGIGSHSATAVAFDNSGLSTILGSQNFTVQVPPPPQYTLSTFAVGNGSVTEGGTYPQNAVIVVSATAGAGAYFTGWTGSFSGDGNPLPVMMTGNLTLYGNFTSLQAQTIAFSPPASLLFPGSPVVLNATASSGLPVSLTVVSGPGALDGNQLTPTAVGSVVIRAAQGGNGQWLAATPVNATVAFDAPPPPTGAISAAPASGPAPLFATISWSTAQATSATVSGPGISSTSLAGNSSATLSTPGTFIYTLTATGPGGQITQSAAVVAAVPQYTLSTFAIGNGSVTAGGAYPANSVISISAAAGAGAYFTGWTGSFLSANNPLSVTMSGNLALSANFTPLQAQTITFSPPAELKFPEPALALNAAASSGLPVSLAVVSGPAVLNGNQLTLTGVGAVVVQAAQGGNGQWLAATPVFVTIAVDAPFPITRIRFNAAGRDARVLNQNLQAGASLIWTDPSGIQASPWPAFANPQPAAIGPSNIPLPAVPIAGGAH